MKYWFAAIFWLIWSLPVAAFDLTDMTEEERAAFRAEVRAFLIENPQVLVEAFTVLEEREAQQQAANDIALLAANRDALFSDGQSWIGGNPDGDITIVEFVDYRCGFCRRAFPEVKQLLENDGNIRLVMKEFPILGEQSTLASQFAIATLQIAGSEAYSAVHDAMMVFRGNFSIESLSAMAASLGIDPAPILAQMDSPDVDRVIAENHALGQILGINGTPTFVLEDQLLRGYVPLDGMTQLVAEARAK